MTDCVACSKTYSIVFWTLHGQVAHMFVDTDGPFEDALQVADSTPTIQTTVTLHAL